MPPLPEFAQEGPTVTLRDENGRSLPCQVEETFDLEGKAYALLLPIDYPIEIFVISEDEEGEEVMSDVEEDTIDTIFATARAVLAEQNLNLHRAAITLTATGDLPELDDENCFTLDLEEDESLGNPQSGEDEEDAPSEDFQILATFFDQDLAYAICTPVEPLLIFATMTAAGEAAIVPPEEFQRLQPLLEAKLYDAIED